MPFLLMVTSHEGRVVRSVAAELLPTAGDDPTIDFTTYGLPRSGTSGDIHGSRSENEVAR